MGSASFGKQANALLRKSTVYQKRNICTNICLLTAPIIFSVLLLIIQALINNVFLSGSDYECGCQCTQCCYSGNPNNCSIRTSGICDSDQGYSCLSTNSSNCGVAFSSATQAAFCPISHPSNWPALADTPAPRWRFAQPSGATTILVTAATSSLATSLGNLLVNQLVPWLTDPSILNPVLDTIQAVDSITGVDYFNGNVLSQLGFQMGTSYVPDSTGNYYIEPSFLTNNDTYVLLPTSTCVSKNISQSQSLDLFTFLLKYAGLPTSISNGTNSNGNVIFSAGALQVVCTDTVVQPVLSVNDINQQLYCGFRQSRCNGSSVIQEYTGAWDFKDSSLSNFNTDFYYNSTGNGDKSDGNRADGSIYNMPALLDMASKAWYRQFVDSSSVVPPTSLLGVMSMPKPSTKLELDFSSLLGPLFYTWVVQLLFPTFLQQLVYEKEKRLRMMMKMHGLGDGAYWLITYCWYFLLYLLYIAVFLIFGNAVGLKYFTKTSGGIQFLFLLFHGLCMIGFAFMLSSLFTSALTAVVFAYLYVFASGLIGSLLLQTFMDKNALWVFFVEWVPAWSLYRGLYEMGAYAFLGVYTNTKGLQWKDLSDSGNGMLATWGIFLVEAVVFMLLGWYLEQVLSSGNGIRRHPLFFLDWAWRKKGDVTLSQRELEMVEGDAAAGHSAVNMNHGELADVKAERDRVERLTDVSNTPIVIRDIQKIYPGQDGGKPKMAVKSLTLGIERGECFGLLGPNGAGKSTAINVLVGFLEATRGTAVIEGLDISREMHQVYKLMGVCPQHDLLWEQLTGEEHLLFYGRLKGFKGEELKEAVRAGLQSVNLLNVGTKQAGKYSGGMKRRLSVAISFMGSPKVVYLDEPSTGLDPASRRGLWEVVKSNKDGRALILTTHSMEEAEMLCDRLGIFVDGQLVCIGNPKEITSRYAGYLVFTITVPQDQEASVQELVRQMSPNALLTYELGGTFKYELPVADISLSGVFAAINQAKQKMTILDWGVANATLEEVFIKFARSANIKSDV